MTAPVENLRKDVRMRVDSDPMMSNVWLLVYLLPVVAVIVGVIVVLALIVSASAITEYPPYTPTPSPVLFAPLILVFVLLPLLALISFIVSIVLRYKLVKRRNTHFRRQSFLSEDLVNAVKAIAEKKDVDVEVALSSCERTVREAKAEETEKSAVLWAILSAIPWIGSLAEWYINYFLMKDFYKHERREDGFWEDVTRALGKCDVTVSLPRREEVMPDRSFVLYLIITIITVGLFGIYWLYVLLKDPNEHFKYHIQVEDQLLSTVESIAM